jgi:threonine/homoserine/homoserine lactone efflux protein
MDIGVIAAFLAVDLLLILTPGADWAYAIAAGLRDRSVVPAVAGLVLGYAGHTILVVAGLAALVAANPGLLTVLTAIGAAYLIWLGGNVLLKPTRPQEAPVLPSARRAVLRGAGISGLNPKGLLLFVALLPQFIRTDAAWPVAVQTGVLGILHMATCAAVYLTVGVLARVVLSAKPKAALVVSRISGVAMVLIGGLLLIS